MLWFWDISFGNRSFEDHLQEKKNYPGSFIDPCIKSFLNKLYTPKVNVQNVPNRNIFVRLLFLGSTSFQIRKNIQILFITFCNLKIVFTSPARVESYIRCSFLDLFTSTTMVASMLPIMVRRNVILRSVFVNIQAFHISLEKRWRLTTIS